MRILFTLLVIAGLSGCTWSWGEDDDNDSYSCSNRDQKRLVRDITYDWYLWNDLLPDKAKVGNYDNAAELQSAGLSFLVGL